MTTYSFVQYNVLEDLVYFKGTPTPGLVDLVNENKDNIPSIRATIQNSTIGQLALLPPSASISIINFLENTPEINLSNSKNVILKIEIIDDTEIGNVDIVSKNLDGSKTYVTKGGAVLIIDIDIIKPKPKYPTLGKCKNCLKLTFDEDNNFNFTGNIGGVWDGTFRNNQKVYTVDIPTFPTNTAPAVYTNYRIFWKPNVTYSGLDYNGNAINLTNQKKWICVPSASIGTPSELSNTTFFHVLSDTSASCPYTPPPLTWYNFFGRNGYFNLQNTPSPASQYNTQDKPCPEFIPTPGITDWGYNCGPNCCVAAPSGSIGAYVTLAECTASCPCPEDPITGSSYGFICTSEGCIPGTLNNTGSFATFEACELSCSFNYGYNCITGNCVEGTALNTGSFETYEQCVATCSVNYGYNCTPNCCVAGTALNTGSFATLEECELSLCCPPPPSPTFCECDPDFNLVTNGSFQNGSTNWNASPTTWTPGTGIVIVDPVGQNVGIGTSVNLNNDNTSSVYLTQTNVFTVGCSYNVCFQASAFATNGQTANATIAVNNGTLPIPNTNLIDGLTSVLTANTVTLTNVTTTDLTFYFGLPQGIIADAEIFIDNICVTLISCPPNEENDCIISGSADTFEIVEYDCVCPEGYVSDGDGNCVSFGSIITVMPVGLPTASYSLGGTFQNLGLGPNIGAGILQPGTAGLVNLTNGSNLPPNALTGQPSLYYQYNLDGTGNPSLGNPSPIIGNPNIHQTQYTFDILKSPFWTDPPAINPQFPGPPTYQLFPLGSTYNPPNPLPSWPWTRWMIKRLREIPSIGNPASAWFGCGTAVPPSSVTKTYYLLVGATREFKVKLNGVNIVNTSPGAISTNPYNPATYPAYEQQAFSRFPAGPSTGLGTLPAPILGYNPYITNIITGSWAYLNSSGNWQNNGGWLNTIGLNNPPAGWWNSRAQVYIYPITVPSGSYGIINVEARPGNTCASGWLGAVLFDNIVTQIANATAINQLNILWDTSILPDLTTLSTNITNFPLNIQNSAPVFLYGYGAKDEPTPSSYIPTCPSGSTPISGSACYGCEQLPSETIPCGDCIECTHGRLYNGYVVDAGGYILQGRGSGGIVNTGSMNASTWVIPTETDWDTLITYTNGGIAPPTVIGSLGTTAGGELKDYTRDLNATCWENPNIGAQTPTGSSGWAGTAGGKRDDLGVYSGLGFDGIWWSANTSALFPNPLQLYTRELKYLSSDVYRNIYTKNYGFSLRLVRPAVAGEVSGTTIYGDYIGKDGTIYDGIVIGTQVWINKNLSETLYNDSSPVTIEINPTSWGNAMISPVAALSCFYDNNSNNASISNGNLDPLTGECYTPPNYYVYQKCGTDEYLVQNISGSTIIPGEVQRDSNQECWEFTNIAAGLPNYPSQTIYTGNYFSGSNYVYDNCDECNAIHTIYMKFGTKSC